MAMVTKPIDLAAARRRRKAQDDGRCKQCGHYRAACSRYGNPCIVIAMGVRDERAD